MYSAIGDHIRYYRRRRGLSQVALAGLVGRSEAWLSQVERGIRSVDRLSVLADVARVLDIEPSDLMGARPWALAPNGSTMSGALNQLRAALMTYESLSGTVAPAALTSDGLRARVAVGMKHYQAARYSAVIEDLPYLLNEADRIWADSNAAAAAFAYVSAYVLAARMATKLGGIELATMTADRAATVSAQAGQSLIAVGMAAFQVANAQLRADQPEPAEIMAVNVARRLTRSARPDLPGLISLAGAMWLIAAVIAARRTDRSSAWDRLDQAERLAATLGEDGNYADTGFGPTNVALHRVSVAAELGDAGEAVRLAAAVDPDRFPPGLLSRRSQLSLDLAWAQNQRRRDAEATLHLIDAERIAPEVVRHNVVAREVVRELLTRTSGTKSQNRQLVELAQRSGILH